MNGIYANRFSITTTETNEVFLTFNMELPKMDDDGKIIGSEKIESVTIAMGNGSYSAFKNMLDKFAEGQKDEGNY